MAANAVGDHSIDGLNFCGCSGIWAPSGINQIKGSDIKEELTILHNVDIIGENIKERMEYDHIEDFRDIKNSDQQNLRYVKKLAFGLTFFSANRLPGI